MQLVGYADCYYSNSDLKKKIDELQQNAEQRKMQILKREYDHAQAVIQMAKLNWQEAAMIWEDILTECPTDMHALKMAFYMYFFTGQKQKQFESMDRVYPYFQKPSTINSK